MNKKEDKSTSLSFVVALLREKIVIECALKWADVSRSVVSEFGVCGTF